MPRMRTWCRPWAARCPLLKLGQGLALRMAPADFLADLLRVELPPRRNVLVLETGASLRPDDETQRQRAIELTASHEF